jgi:hypothetical protein
MMKWHKGPPPSIGWWPASFDRNELVYRWWNGSCWSVPALKGDSAQTVARCANIPAQESDMIEWTDRPKSWPKRSRT